MDTVRSTGQSDVGSRVSQDPASRCDSQNGSHKIRQIARGKLLGANLDHLHAITGGALRNRERIGNAVTIHKIRRSRLGNSTTHSFTPLYFSMTSAGTSTAMSPENSSRERSGFSIVRSSVAGIWLNARRPGRGATES